MTSWLPILCAVLSVASAAVCVWVVTRIGRLQSVQNLHLQVARAVLELGDAVSAQQQLLESKDGRIDVNAEAIALLLDLHCAAVAGEPGSLKLVLRIVDDYPDAGKEAN